MPQKRVEVPPPVHEQRPRRSNPRGSIWTLMVSRVAQGVVIMIIVSILVFLATQAMPGDVVKVVLGVNSTPERVSELQAQLGLDQPLYLQYWQWFSGVLHGDFGQSLVTQIPVTDIIGTRIRNSLVLSGMAFLIMLPVSLILGVASAYLRDRGFDRGFLGVSMVLNATPGFVTGTLLIWLLATNVFPVFPPVSVIPPGDMPWWHPAAMVLPVTTLVIGGSMYLSRLIRVSFIDVLSSEYIQMTKLKGLSTLRMLFRHALPNAVAPAIPAASLVAAFTIGGVVVVEYLYGYPGVGTAIISAATNRDLPVLQALVLLMAASYFVFNLVADLVPTARRDRE